MTTLKRLAATALSAAIIAAPVLTVSSADAAPERAAMKWSKIAKWEGATQQACKKSVKNGKAWKVYTRVVNGRKAEVGVGLQVLKDDKITKTASTPIMGKGKTSKTVSVVLPISDKFSLVGFQFQGQMGDGGPVSIKKIRIC